MSSHHLSRLDELQTSIAARLKKVCYDWPRDRFDEMVRNLAFITVKYERQMLSCDGVGADELVSRMKTLRQRKTDR